MNNEVKKTIEIPSVGGADKAFEPVAPIANNVKADDKPAASIEIPVPVPNNKDNKPKNETVTKNTLETSGSMREYSTGAHRDADTTKGRCDLIPWRTLTIMNNTETGDLEKYGIEHQFDIITTAVHTTFTNDVGTKTIVASADEKLAKRVLSAVKAALTLFEKEIDVTWQGLMLEASYQYKDGAAKYGENNWKKGMPLWVYLDSGMRHYLKFKQGDKDEAHDRAFIWNMLCFVWAFDNQYNVGNALYDIENV